jgi:hypothetical protein
MTNHNRSSDSEACKSFCQHGGLSFRCPQPVAWALTVPIARPVKSQHPVVLSDQTKHAARDVVFRLDSIAVQQHDRRPANPCFEVVQPNAACVNEPPGWRMLPLNPASIGANLKDNPG